MPADEEMFDSTAEIVRAYQAGGFKGYLPDERAKDEFLSTNPVKAFSSPKSGKGKRALLYGYVLRFDPQAYSERQTVGDCVTHGSRSARDCNRAVSILIHGKPNDWLVRTATEPTYGARGHGREGMSPALASRFERDVGFCPRQNFPGVVDLSKYDGSLGARWGRQGGVPEGVKELCRRNKVGTIALVRTMDDAMDALFNGYGIHSGQYAAWSNKPDAKKNIHPRSSPGWAHDMAVVFYDDTRTHWPFRVWGIANSWGRWNTPVPDWPADYPPQVPGMIITDDEGFAVCVEAGDMWAYSDVQGFPARDLPDLGSIGRI
jgi:hypothetical protein